MLVIASFSPGFSFVLSLASSPQADLLSQRTFDLILAFLPVQKLNLQFPS